jgi:hypothetical protein
VIFVPKGNGPRKRGWLFGRQELGVKLAYREPMR